MEKSIKFLVSLLLTFLVLAAFFGCYERSLPYDYFKSLQELENSIDSGLSVVFPDTTRYQFADKYFYRKVYKGKSNIVQGYDLGGDLDPSKSDTSLWDMSVSCRLLDATYDKRNPEPSLCANINECNTDIFEQIIDKSNDADLQKLNLYPKGAKIVCYIYDFDFNGCRFYVNGTLVIQLENLKILDGKEVEAMVQNGKSEMLDLVKSIIEKE
jgi:hypothetical protein